MSVRFFYFKTNPGFDSITEKRRINAIVKSNITSPSPVQVRIYYNLTKLEQLLKRKQAIDLSLKHHVVYQYSCPHSGCNTSTYIGFTQNTILERMRQHKYNCSIKEHLSLYHDIKANNLSTNTSILSSARTKNDLCILESLWQRKSKPKINKREENSANQLYI